MAKLSKKLPSRVTNTKAAAKRERSWRRNQEMKMARIADQKRREAHNREVGSTGKQRANAAVKLERSLSTSI